MIYRKVDSDIRKILKHPEQPDSLPGAPDSFREFKTFFKSIKIRYDKHLRVNDFEIEKLRTALATRLEESTDSPLSLSNFCCKLLFLTS